MPRRRRAARVSVASSADRASPARCLAPPVERVQRLEKEVMELRAFRLRAKGVLAETRRMLNSLEEEMFSAEPPLRFEQEDLTEQVETPSDDGVSPGVPR